MSSNASTVVAAAVEGSGPPPVTDEASKENAKENQQSSNNSNAETAAEDNNTSSKTPTKTNTPTTNTVTAVEFEPPLACVRRLLKHSLPSSTNVGKDASTAFARASGIFIIYLTACANDFARENRRQTITANDVLAAMKELEFDEFTPELTEFLTRYRATEKSKREAKAKAKAAEMGADQEGEDSTTGETEIPNTPQSQKSSLSQEDEASATVADVTMKSDGDQTEEEEDKSATEETSNKPAVATPAKEDDGVVDMEE